MNMQPESEFETAQRKEKIRPITKRWNNWDGPIVDVGGGDGSVFRDIDCPVPMDLIEPNPDLRAKSWDYEIYSRTYSVAELFERGCNISRYSAALCMGVLEHVNRPDLTIEWLLQFKRIYITVPNADSLHRHVGVSMGMLEEIDELHEGDKSIGHKKVWKFDEFANLILDVSSEFNANFNCEIGTIGFKFLDNDGMKPFLKDYRSLCQMAEIQGFSGWNRKHGAEIYAYLERDES